ncbi:hypothetical protein [Heyndrickxia oleronia]|uniref:Lipoprotein n=1 Tax=Heyndrickxia oleronia TaxID=38875 RepID=A0AAW6T0B9_9BACI|nr:hypothetical protein [Heyndrickxia oleronia]MDH5163948.1 hypothetical protein [Heyndrickxia oleronia]
MKLKIFIMFLLGLLLLNACSRDSNGEFIKIIESNLDNKKISIKDITEIKLDKFNIFTYQDSGYLYLFVFEKNKLVISDSMSKEELEINPQWEYHENNQREVYLISGGFKNKSVSSIMMNKTLIMPNIIRMNSYNIFFEIFDEKVSLPIDITFN